MRMQRVAAAIKPHENGDGVAHVFFLVLRGRTGLHAQNHPQFDDIALVCFGRCEESITVVTGSAEGEIEL